MILGELLRPDAGKNNKRKYLHLLLCIVFDGEK